MLPKKLGNRLATLCAVLLPLFSEAETAVANVSVIDSDAVQPLLPFPEAAQLSDPQIHSGFRRGAATEEIPIPQPATEPQFSQLGMQGSHCRNFPAEIQTQGNAQPWHFAPYASELAAGRSGDSQCAVQHLLASGERAMETNKPPSAAREYATLKSNTGCSAVRETSNPLAHGIVSVDTGRIWPCVLAAVRALRSMTSDGKDVPLTESVRERAGFCDVGFVWLERYKDVMQREKMQYDARELQPKPRTVKPLENITDKQDPWFVRILMFMEGFIVLVIMVYGVRHVMFTLNRLFGAQRRPYIDIDTGNWPTVTVFVPCHNEEAVIADSLTALLQADYPSEKVTIVPLNDRSVDRTREIVDQFAAREPERIKPFHRVDGKPGKAAALKEATLDVTSEIILVFDADYLPAQGLMRQLVAPFFDPEVGAVMGRVVPQNAGTNLLTRLLDLERSGGYQVDQQARMNMNLVPQYGGTVGGVRRSALLDVGGWHDDVLAEDTDLTYRLLINGWKTIYQNRSECYEEVPESWSVRVRQIMRWAKGHNQALSRHYLKVLTMSGIGVFEKIDGLALLWVYAIAPLLVLGWLIALILFYFHPAPLINGTLVLFSLVTFSSLGNFSAFFEIAAATYLDGNRGRIKLLPLTSLGFLVSIFSISRSTVDQVFFDKLRRREFYWDKTVRYRKRPT